MKKEDDELYFGENILRYREDIIQDIKELVSIPSCAVLGNDPEKPFGEEPARALGWILHRAEELGLTAENVGNYAGHAEYGEGKEVAAVLTHVDVVPAGDGWASGPFAAVEQNGKLYGRGVADDKGAAVVALYCLKALKDGKIQGKRRLRAIFGAGEEVGMHDMERYFQTQELPVMAFTPDSDYGICNREKGILHLELSVPTHDGTTLTAFRAGAALNSVPDKAYALLDCTEAEDHQLLRLADAKEGSFAFHYTIDGMQIESCGKASHAMEPYKGKNAAAHLINLLCAGLGHRAMGSLCAFLNQYIGLETDGASLGIKQEDAFSGPLTLNLGVVEIGANYARAAVDIRYPVTADGEQIVKTIGGHANREGVGVRVLDQNKPLFVREDEPLIGLLKASYRAVTGEEPGLYATGGGTYARRLGGHGVAFGPVFQGEECRLHNANERIDIEHFMLHAQICLEAMYRMLTQ